MINNDTPTKVTISLPKKLIDEVKKRFGLGNGRYGFSFIVRESLKEYLKRRRT